MHGPRQFDSREWAGGTTFRKILAHFAAARTSSASPRTRFQGKTRHTPVAHRLMEVAGVRWDVTRRIVLQVLLALALAAPAAAWWISTPSDDSSQPPTATPAVAITGVMGHRPVSPLAGLPEEAAMVLVGTALIGAAAAVRRAA